jgi:hypothetical protein
MAFSMVMAGSPDPAYGSVGGSSKFSNAVDLCSKLFLSFEFSLDSKKEACFFVLTLSIISLKEMKLFFLGFKLGQAASTGFLTTTKALSVEDPLASKDVTSLELEGA